ncbi:MAG: alpha-L-fucosidase [Clostridia bacterium]|nr:alpha-L-fucosidase [Clostridia bacterium]
MSANTIVADQHSIIGNTKEATIRIERTTHPEAQWFYQPVQLGLFIHFGISTVHGDLDISWGMMENPERRAKGNGIATPREYWALAERFRPEHFQPEEWLRAAKDAGFTYAVFTTKHHDGYALWPTDASEFSTKTYLNGRDLVGEYVHACRKVGLKVGFYYSPPDWRFNSDYMSFMCGSRTAKYPERPHKDIDHKDIEGNLPEMPKAHYDRYIDYVNTQVRELLTRYGKIDLFWFDGSVKDLTNVITIDEIRALQPHIVVNDRLWGFGVGDYCSQYECRLPEEKPDGPWETCHIWHVGGGWSYVKNADKYRDLEITMHQYEVCKQWGGNLLLNIAPAADGSVPEDYYKAVRAFGNALKASK